MAAPTIVKTESGNVGTGSQLSLTLGTLSGTLAGDVVIAWIATERTTITPTISGGSTAWTSIATTTNTNHISVVVWKRIAAGDIGATVTGDVTTGRRMAGGLIVLRGSDDPVWSAKAAVTTAATSHTTNSITPTENDALLLALVTSAATSSPFIRDYTWEAGWTERADQSSQASATSNAFTSLATKALSGQSGVSQAGPTATPSSSAEYNALIISATPGDIPPTVVVTGAGTSFWERDARTSSAGSGPTPSFTIAHTSGPNNAAGIREPLDGWFFIPQDATSSSTYTITATSSAGSDTEVVTVPAASSGPATGTPRRRVWNGTALV